MFNPKLTSLVCLSALLLLSLADAKRRKYGYGEEENVEKPTCTSETGALAGTNKSTPIVWDFEKLGCGKLGTSWTIRIVGTPTKIPTYEERFNLNLVVAGKGEGPALIDEAKIRETGDLSIPIHFDARINWKDQIKKTLIAQYPKGGGWQKPENAKGDFPFEWDKEFIVEFSTTDGKTLKVKVDGKDYMEYVSDLSKISRLEVHGCVVLSLVEVRVTSSGPEPVPTTPKPPMKPEEAAYLPTCSSETSPSWNLLMNGGKAPASIDFGLLGCYGRSTSWAITVVGKPVKMPNTDERFSINLVSEGKDKGWALWSDEGRIKETSVLSIPLHFDARFNFGNDKQVCLASSYTKGGSWTPEKRAKDFPFEWDKEFKLIIGTTDSKKVTIFIDKKSFLEYDTDVSKVDRIEVHGAVELSLVEIKMKPTCSSVTSKTWKKDGTTPIIADFLDLGCEQKSTSWNIRVIGKPIKKPDTEDRFNFNLVDLGRGVPFNALLSEGKDASNIRLSGKLGIPLHFDARFNAQGSTRTCLIDSAPKGGSWTKQQIAKLAFPFEYEKTCIMDFYTTDGKVVKVSIDGKPYMEYTKDVTNVDRFEIHGGFVCWYVEINFDPTTSVPVTTPKPNEPTTTTTTPTTTVQTTPSTTTCKPVPQTPKDVICVLDGSGSITANVFYNKVLPFAKELAKTLNIAPAGNNLAIVQYANQARLEIDFTSAKTVKEFQDRVTSINYMNLGTQTGRAMDFTAKTVLPKARPNSQKMVIVVTDGESQDKVVAPAELLKSKGVTVLAIGVGKAVKVATLEQIAAGNKQNVYQITNYAELNKLLTEKLDLCK